MTTSSDLEGARLLVVEDSSLVAAAIQRTLSGAQCDVAGTVASARDRMGHGSFDAAIVDGVLPDGSGLEIIAALRSSITPCCSVFITGFTSRTVAIDASKAGASSCLLKPFSSGALVDAAAFARACTQKLRAGVALLCEAADRSIDAGWILDSRQKRALELMLLGLSRLDIARELGVSERQAQRIVHEVFEIAQAQNKRELLARFSARATSESERSWPLRRS